MHSVTSRIKEITKDQPSVIAPSDPIIVMAYGPDKKNVMTTVWGHNRCIEFIPSLL